MKSSSAGALLFAIITALVLSLVASTFVLLASSQYRVVDNEVDRIIKYYRAQAGMEWAIYNLYSNTAGWVPPAGDGNFIKQIVSIDSNDVTIRVTDLPSTGLSSYSINVTVD